MSKTAVKRHSRTRIDTDKGTQRTNQAGVGARHTSPPVTVGGGGYQNNCTFLKFGEKSADPRMDELRRMGLPKLWLDVAEIVGFDSFLAMWRRLEEEPGAVRDDGRIDIRMRSYRSYLRFQRNLFIETLYAAGLDQNEIQKRVSQSLREKLSPAYISRLRNTR